MSLVVTNCLLDDQKQDILVNDGRIQEIGEISDEQKSSADTQIDGSNMLAAPTLMNGHTHAAMTLFRGFGDDLPLQTWLEDKIWPLEEKLTDEDVYWATRLACLEMIRTGTTFFNDMYWEFEAIKDAVADSGIRARISGVFIDQFDEELADQQRQMNRELADQREDLPGRIDFALGPHSIYTVSADSLEWIANFSRDQDIPVHIHLAETEWEVEDCREKHGTTPVRYLDQMNFFHDGVVAAHGLWLEDEEIQILAENDVSVIYNPMSNLKLTSGADFRYEALRDAGVQVCLGTDGVASNNNLNLFEEIKTASLLQKNRTSDPTTLPAQEAFGLATRQAADVFELNAGRIEEGRQADFMLIDTNTAETALADVHDTNSLLAYALTPDAIDTVICSGDVLMRNGEPTDSEYSKIIEKHRELTVELCE